MAGANPASNHPRLIVKLVDIRASGGTVIVVNPVKELGLCRFRIPSRPALAALRLGRLRHLPPAARRCGRRRLQGAAQGCDRDGRSRSRLPRGARGVDGTRSRPTCRRPNGRRCSTRAGSCARTSTARLTRCVRARRGVMLWAMGLTHHEHGVQNVVALANLAAGPRMARARGVRPASDPRAQQRAGRRLRGFRPGAEGGLRDEDGGGRTACRHRLRAGSRHLPLHGGRARRAHAALRCCWAATCSPSNPDRAWAARALRRIDTTCALTTKLNEGHVHGRGRQPHRAAGAGPRRGTPAHDPGEHVQLRAPVRGR